MKAGFARHRITPALGTRMMGFGQRDMDHGAERIHDDIYVHALYIEHGGEPALLLGYDLCFVGREEADRLKGAIGRVLDLLPRQILLNASHNHVGPSVGTWYSAGYEAPDRDYLQLLEDATVAAARAAFESQRDASLWAGVGRTALPMNRRRMNEDGVVENRPNPGGSVYDKLPVCLFRDGFDQPLALLFSASVHPSMIGGFEISAEYPGAAVRRIDRRLGRDAALFLQGVGGDAKPCVIGEGADRWLPGTWERVEQAGDLLAGEVMATVKEGLAPATPRVRTASVETVWRLEDPPPRSYFEAVLKAEPAEPRNVRRLWAERQLALLDAGRPLPDTITLTIQGIQLAEDLRIVAIEGEALHTWGRIIDDFYGIGITIPLGYSNGTGLYLPTSEMLPEGGYEVESYWEYGLPAPLAKGMEAVVAGALGELRARGIA